MSIYIVEDHNEKVFQSSDDEQAYRFVCDIVRKRFVGVLWPSLAEFDKNFVRSGASYKSFFNQLDLTEVHDEVPVIKERSNF